MRRGRLEMKVDLLKAIMDHSDYTKSRLIAVANWSSTDGVKTLEELNDKGFCKRYPNGKTWILTQKGWNWLTKIMLLIEEAE